MPNETDKFWDKDDEPPSSPDEPTMPLTPEALYQAIKDNHTTSESGHKRLRYDYRELEERVDALAESHGKTIARLDKIEGKKVEITEIRLTPSTVVGIVGFCLMFAGGMWTIDSRSEVRQQDILTKMAAQAAIERDHNESTAQLQAERASVMSDKIDQLDKKEELQRIKLENLREMVLKLNKGR